MNINEELLAVLKDARTAINSLSQDTLGTGFITHPSGEQEPYPLRDELLHNITGAVNRLQRMLDEMEEKEKEGKE